MFDEFHQTVREMIQEFGGSALFIRQQSGEYNPATGSVDTTELKFAVHGILLDFTAYQAGVAAKAGTMILEGDKQFFMQPPEQSEEGFPGVNIDPTKDSIKVGTNTFKVVSGKEINPNGLSPILYEFVLRR